MNLYGIKIVQSNLLPPTRPRRQLSPTLPVSDAFREDFNKWLEEFFGHERYFLMWSGNTIVTAPENVVMIKELIQTNETGNARPGGE